MEPFELLTKRNWLLVNSICAFLMTVLVCSFIFFVSSVLCTCLAFSYPNTDSYNDAPGIPDTAAAFSSDRATHPYTDWAAPPSSSGHTDLTRAVYCDPTDFINPNRLGNLSSPGSPNSGTLSHIPCDPDRALFDANAGAFNSQQLQPQQLLGATPWQEYAVGWLELTPRLITDSRSSTSSASLFRGG